MNKYKPTIKIESTDNYEKAREDLLTALHSFSKLSYIQQECLAKELFGAANVATVLNIMLRVFRNY